MEKLWKVSKMLTSFVDNISSGFKITTPHAMINHRPSWMTINETILQHENHISATL